jgi:hypothetical protein
LHNYPWSEFEINAIKSETLKEEKKQALDILRKTNKNIVDLDSTRLV